MSVQNWDQPDHAGIPVYPYVGHGIAQFHTIGIVSLHYVRSPQEIDQFQKMARSVHVGLGAPQLRQLAADLLRLADVLDQPLTGSKQ